MLNTTRDALRFEKLDFPHAVHFRPLSAARLKPNVLVVSYYVETAVDSVVVRARKGPFMRQYRIAIYTEKQQGDCTIVIRTTSMIVDTEWLR